jgi:hypothetical protein
VVTNSAGGVRENRSSAIAGGEDDRGMTTLLEIKAARIPRVASREPDDRA